MGMIPPPNDNYSHTSSTDDVQSLGEISNFSLEIEMLNKLHVEKNNPNPNLNQLPIMFMEHLDHNVALYKENRD